MRFICCTLLVFTAVLSAHGQRLVSYFKPAIVFSPSVSSCETDATGNIYVSGQFHFVGTRLTGGLIKLKPDGKLDESFYVKPGTLGSKAYPQANGKVYLVGQYRLADGSITTLVRLNADGTLDPTFVAGITSRITDLVVQSTGKVVVIGNFLLIPVPGYDGLARLNTDGSLDQGFAQHNFLTEQFGKGVAIDKDDKIYVCDFTKVRRLDPDGIEEVAYAGIGSEPEFRTRGITMLASGKALVHGIFTKYNGVSAPGIVRLNTDGAVDPTFSFAGTGSNLPQGDIITELSNGNLLVSPVCCGGTYGGGYVELEPNGTFKRHIASGTGTLTMAESNGGVIILGGFSTIMESTASPNIARIKSTGELDAAFVAPRFYSTASDLPALADAQGRVIVGSTAPGARGFINNGVFTSGALHRLTPAGDRDNTFSISSSEPNLWSGYVQSDGKYVLSGVFPGSIPTPILLRFNTDGTIDNTFVKGTTNQSQGRITKFSGNSIYTTGQWSQYNGVTTGGFVRLNSDGSIAQTYTAWQQPGVARAFDVQPDGRVLFSGSSPVALEELRRFNTDGTLDTTYPVLAIGGTGVVPIARAMAIDANGSAYIGGSFNSIGSIVSPRLVKLTPDGSQAPDFSIGTGFTGTASLFALQVLPSGNIAAAGSLSGYNGVSANGLVLIDPTGAAVPMPNVAFGSGTLITKLHWANNALYISGQIWNTDLTELSSFRKISFANDPAPAAPGNLKVEITKEGVFDVSWTDNSSNEVAFLLERSLSATSGFTVFKAVGSNATSVKDSTITGNVAYHYRVRASNDGGESAYSNTASLTWVPGVLGVEDKALFAIYPNPARHQVTIESSEPGTIQIISLSGASMSIPRVSNGTTVVDLKGMASGVYILKFATERNVITKKLLVLPE